MQLFSTILSINDTLTKDAFIELAIRWNQGSTHESNIIPDIVWNGERNIRFGDDKCWMQVEEYRNKNIIAIRYEKTEDDGVVWDTDYVMNFSDMQMAIRLDRSYLEEALAVDPKFSTPAFIALLIDEGYVKDDNGLEVGRKPIFIRSEDLSLIADVINEKEKYRFPVVYISKTYSGSDPVDVWEVAKRLKGVAHIMVQENPRSGRILREMCADKNEFNGAVGIYYPNPAFGHKKILNHPYEGSRTRMAEKVIQSVIQYSNSQMVDKLYTWAGVSNSLVLDKYSSKREELAASESARKLSESAARLITYEAEMRAHTADLKVEAMREEVKKAQALAQENEALVESTDDEIEQMRAQIKELIHKNDALAFENQGLRAKVDEKSAEPLLYLGSEDEFFPGEIKEFVLQALVNEQKRAKQHTRRADVLGDIIRSNSSDTGELERRRVKIKDMLTGYTSMTAPVRSALKDLGFDVKEDGKHYKLIYYGDGRYWTTLDKTPSDKAHGGKNAALNIIRDMF